MNKYLIFRTDNVGDFLLTAILIKSIKYNDPKSHITIVASKRNYSYLNNFPYVDDVIELENNTINKIKLIFKLKNKKFENIIIHDNKKRSKFISFFLKSPNKILFKNPNQYSQIELITIILKKLNFSFFNESLNILEHKQKKKISKNELVQLHFDEKWIHKSYINKYTNIEPTKDELIFFISSILLKTNNNLIITTGRKTPKLLNIINNFLLKKNIKLYENLSFIQLEDITINSDLLISCHGAISHIASAKKIKQIDIIDDSYPYHKWTSHFRNYNYINRESFNNLTKKIIKII